MNDKRDDPDGREASTGKPAAPLLPFFILIYNDFCHGHESLNTRRMEKYAPNDKNTGNRKTVGAKE